MVSALPRRAGALLLIVGATLTLLFASASTASAHAALIGTNPGNNAVVRAAPREVTLTFSEGVSLPDGAVRVLDPQGTRVDSGKSDHTGGKNNAVRIGLHSGLPDGTFTVAWKAVSEDSHPISGAFTFSIGAPSKTTVSLSQEQGAGGTIGSVYDTVRYFAYGGFALLIGGTAFILLCWPKGALRLPQQRLLLGGWCTLLITTIALLLLRGPYENGGSLGDAFNLGSVQDALGTRSGTALAVRLLLLAGAGAFLALLVGQSRRPGGVHREVRLGLLAGGAVLAVGMGSTWAVAEHASAGIQTGVAIPVDVVHLVAVALWLGGLVALLTSLFAPAGGPVPTEAVNRFSRVAFCSVVTLVATGSYQAWRQLGSWSAFTSTSYGKLLLAKIITVALLLVAAWYSRRWVRRLVDPGQVGGLLSRATAKGPDSRPDVCSLARVSAPGDRAGGHEEPVPAARRGHPAAQGARPTAQVAPDVTASDRDASADLRGIEDRDAAADAETTAGSDGTVQGRHTGNGVPRTRRSTVSIEGEDAPPNGDRADEGSGRGARVVVAEPAAGVGGVDDPVRSRQLARQRAARDTARVKRDRDADPRRIGLRRTVFLETGIAVAVLGITTVLTTTESGRTAEQVAAASSALNAIKAGPVHVMLPYDTGGPRGKGKADITIDPGRVGKNGVHCFLTDPEGDLVDVAEFKVRFTLPQQDIGPLDAGVKHLDIGHWITDSAQIPVSGKWQMSVTVRTSDIDQVTKTVQVKIG